MNTMPSPSSLLPAVFLSLVFILPLTSDAAAPKGISSPAPTPSTYVYAYSGEQEIGGPKGSDYLRFFTPEVNYFLSDVTPPHPTTSGSGVMDVGGGYANFPNARLTGLTQPTGDGLIATFKPGVGGLTASNNVAMLYGDLNYAPDTNVIAQTGTPEADLPEGVTIKKFLTLDAEGVPFFFATLQGPGVSASNSLALCTFNYYYGDTFIVQSRVAADSDPDLNYYGYPLIILARPGDSVVTSGSVTKTIKTITTLVGSKGTLADGRWRTFNFDSFSAEIGDLITFTDGSQGIYVIPSYAEEDPSEWTFLVQTGFVTNIDGLDNYTINSFGLPAFDYEDYAVLANVSQPAAASPEIRRKLGAIAETSSNDVALIYGDIFGASAEVLASKGEAVTQDSDGNTLTGVTISGLSDPVVGNFGSVAFMVTMSGTQAPASGIEYYDNNDEEGPYLLADVGGSAPDVTGTGIVGHWAGFKSLVLPSDNFFYSGFDVVSEANPKDQPEVGDDDVGPIFVGTLAINAADGVNAGNNLGLWALDGYGILQLIFRSGETVTVDGVKKVVRTFKALTAPAGSVGAVHGYDDLGDVAAIANFTDGSSALLVFSIPQDDQAP